MLAFASSSSSQSVPKPVIPIRRNADPVDCGRASIATPEHKLGSGTLARHAHPPSPSNSPQSLFRNVFARFLTFPSSQSFQSSSTDNGDLADFPGYIGSYEPYPLSVQASPQPRSRRQNLPPPVTDDNPLSFPSSQTVVFPSEPKDHSPIFDFKRLNLALVLQNSGSVARDHLASERTFLAYVRTSLALTSAGIGIVQLFATIDSKASSIQTLTQTNRRTKRFAVPLGVLTLTFSLFLLLLGEWFLPFKAKPLQRGEG